MDAIGADSANGMKRHNKCVEFLPILYRCVYARRKRPAQAYFAAG